MPNPSTEQVTTHTLTLTDAALRTASRLALDSAADRTPEHDDAWRAFTRLGMPATRRQMRAEPPPDRDAP